MHDPTTRPGTPEEEIRKLRKAIEGARNVDGASMEESTNSKVSMMWGMLLVGGTVAAALAIMVVSQGRDISALQSTVHDLQTLCKQK